MNDSQKAINLSEKTIEKFEEELKLNKLDEESDKFKGAINIYNLIKENMYKWKNEVINIYKEYDES